MKKILIIAASAALAFTGAAQASTTKSSSSNTSSNTSASAGISLDKTQIMLIQFGLTESGYSTGGVDGAWGNNSASALRKYQASIGASQTGTLTASQACSLISVGISNHGSSAKRPGFCSSN